MRGRGKPSSSSRYTSVRREMPRIFAARVWLPPASASARMIRSRSEVPDAVSSGKVELDWGATQVTVSGRIPLQPQLRGGAFTGTLESKGLNDMLGFFGIERPRPTAPASVPASGSGAPIA